MRDFFYGLNQIPPEEVGSGITREMERRWRVLQGLQVMRQMNHFPPLTRGMVEDSDGGMMCQRW